KRDQCMPHLMVGNNLTFVGIEQAVLLLQAGDDPLDRIREIFERYRFSAAPRREQRRFVDQIGEISPSEARGERRYRLGIDVGSQTRLAQVDIENVDAAALIRPIHQDLPVEAASTE